MKAIVLDNNNVETTYIFEPNPGRLFQMMEFYSKAYMTLQIQGYQIIDEDGRVVKFGGLI